MDLIVHVTQTIDNNIVSFTGNSTICSGMTFAGSITGTPPFGGEGVGNYQFQWFKDEGSGWVAIPGQVSQNLTSGPVLTVSPTSFRRQVKSGNCTDESNVITFTVLPGIQNNSITGVPAICNGATPAAIIGTPPTQGSGSYTYLWEQSVTPFSTWTPASGTNNSPDYTPPALNQTTHYRRTVYSTPCELLSNEIIVDVNEIPSISSVNEKYICSNDFINYTPTSTVAGTTYSWTSVNDPSGCISGNLLVGSGIVNDMLVNSCTSLHSLVYTITPQGPGTTLCVGSSFPFTVYVNPVAHITNPVNQQTVVSGNSTTPIVFISDVTGVNYQWSVSNNTCPLNTPLAYPSGVGSLIDSQLIDVATGGPSSCTITYTANAGISGCPGTNFFYQINVNLAPTVYNVSCGGPICEGLSTFVSLSGSDIGVDYVLVLDGIPDPSTLLPGTGSQLTWNGITAGGSYTVQATNTSNGQVVLMPGSYNLVVNPNPISNYLIGSTGNCPGDLITLNFSESNVNYELIWNGIPTGNILSGPGPLNFGPQSNPGVYTILATNIITSCWSNIQGSILINASPLEFLFDPAGPQCAGDSFGLQDSETGVSYELWCTPLATGSPIYIGTYPGTGLPIPFGIQTVAGTYFIHAIHLFTGCDIYFTDTKVLWPNPEPYNISPQGPNICGLTTIGLDDSQVGYTYEVHLLDINGIPYPTPSPDFTIQTGTGSALVFGTSDAPGTYVIIAFDQNHICTAQMYGSVTILPEPTQYWIYPTGNIYCVDQAIGTEIFLEDSEIGVDYTLSNGGSVLITLAGTGNQLSFGFQNQPGTYSITALNPTNTCTNDMLGDVTISLRPQVYTMNPVNDICPGDEEIWLSSSQTGVIYTLNTPGGPIPLPGTGDPLYWGYFHTPGTYTIEATLTTIPDCPTLMDGDVIIHPNPGIFDVLHQGINCISTTIGLSGSELNTTYELIHEDGSSLTPPEIYIPAVAGPFWFPTPQPVGNYTVKATNSFGCDTLMNGVVIIDLGPTVDAGPSDMTICNTPPFSVPLTGTATNYSSVSWTSSSTGTFSDPNNLISTYILAPEDISSQMVVLTLTAFGTGGCLGTQVTDQITIHILSPFADAGPDQVICEGASVMLDGTINGGTTTGLWSSSGDGTFLPDPATIDAEYVPGIADITLGTVTLTLTTTNAAPCPDISDDLLVTINPIPVVTDPVDQVLCNGSLSLPVIFNGSVPGTVFTWTNTLPAIGLAGSGTGDIPAFTAVNNGSTPVVASITVTPTFTFGGVSCTGNQQTFTITVNPNGQLNDPLDQVVCNGDLTDAVAFSTINTIGTTTYNWTNDLTSIGLAASGSGDIAAFTAINTGTAPVTATITVTPTFSNGSVDCIGTAQTFTITVNPNGQVNDPADQVVCNGDLTNAVIFSTNNTVGTTAYNWTNDLTSIGLPASGTGDIAAFTAINTGTAPVVATITVTPTFSNGSVDCIGTAQTFTITVNPNGQVNDPADQVVCNGDLTNPVIFTTNNTVGTTTYNWTNDLTSIGLAASGTGDIAAFTAINTGTAPVVATITVTPTFSNGSVDCIGTAQTFTITVNPNGQVNDPADQVVCNGDLTNAVIFTTNNTVGTTTYNWTNDLTSIGLAASGTGDIAAFTAINTGTAPVVATITVTPTFSNGSVDCIGTAQTFTITVNPNGQVNDPIDQVVCNGDLTNTVIFTTNNTVGTTTYNWTNDLTSIGLAASGTGDIAAFTAINTGTAPVVATITVTPTFSNGSVDCIGTAQTFTITVNPNGQVNDPADQVVCNGDLTNPVIFTTNNTVGTTTYNWTNDLTSIGLPASGTGDIAAFTAINTGTAPVVATITVTPTFSNGSVDCIGTAQTFTITVNPNGQVNDPADQVVCDGDLTNPVIFSTNNTVGTTTYNWTNDLTSIGLAASGTGDIAAFTAINTGTAPVTATITVTPAFSNGSVDCIGTAQTFTITVNPNGQVNDPADQVVCNGDLTNAVIFSTNNTVGTTTYNWTNDLTSIGLAASGNGDISAFTAINTGTAPVIATITVTPIFSNGSVDCIGTAQTFTITVNPNGQVNDPADQVVCDGDLTNPVIFTSNNTVGTTTYNWNNDLTSIGLPASGTGDIAAFTAINTGTAPVVATITVTPTFSNGSVDCIGTAQTFTITVNPNGQVNDPTDQVVCNGT
ncbi:MAG: hypothetical protein IPH45_11645 [Bacteroidales bacterium]|nr:hypothetical protein [Bacteroidales bacterium]